MCLFEPRASTRRLHPPSLPQEQEEVSFEHLGRSLREGTMLENEPGSSVTGIGRDRLSTAAPEALVVVRDHRIELANEAALALLGGDPVGLDIHELRT